MPKSNKWSICRNIAPVDAGSIPAMGILNLSKNEQEKQNNEIIFKRNRVQGTP